MTDLDGTMTSGGEGLPSEQELSDRVAVRALLEKEGVVAGAVTARTCALTLSSKAYRESATVRELMPPPKWGVDPKTKRHMVVPLEEDPYFQGCLDFDWTASFGGHIIARNGHGYMVDLDYDHLLRYDYAKSEVRPEAWRLAMLWFTVEELAEYRPYMSKLEVRYNYEQGLTNSPPQEFRYQYDFLGSAGLEKMRQMQSLIWHKSAQNTLAARIQVVDESKPHPSDPELSRYTLYLVPKGGLKERMVHRVVGLSLKAAGLKAKDSRLFYAGDTLTDLNTGLYAGGDAKMTFLLPSKSRLAPYILGKERMFGSQDLSFLWADPEVGRKADRLRPTDKKGVYEYVVRARGHRRNTIVIGDERYPGTTPPGSIAEFLEEFLV